MSDSLQHHGILGMKWGVRRYQNEDGSLTPAGARRYNRQAKQNSSAGNSGASSKRTGQSQKTRSQSINKKKVLAIGAAAAGTALAACGIYKLKKSGKLDGLVQAGKSAIQYMNYALNMPAKASRYNEWAQINDMRIRNHSSL